MIRVVYWFANVSMCIIFVTFIKVIVDYFVEIKRINTEYNNKLRSLEKDSTDIFVVSEYLGRIEKVAEDIQRKKQTAKHEPTVLWLLIDGLQINEDGTRVWIKKEKPKSLECLEKVSCWQVGQPDYYSALLYADNIPFYAVSPYDICQASREQLLLLEYQNLQSQLMTTINSAQTQALTNAFIPMLSQNISRK